MKYSALRQWLACVALALSAYAAAWGGFKLAVAASGTFCVGLASVCVLSLIFVLPPLSINALQLLLFGFPLSVRHAVGWFLTYPLLLAFGFLVPHFEQIFFVLLFIFPLCILLCSIPSAVFYAILANGKRRRD